MTDDRYIPPGLLLQWHITERCNLRCQHCYQQEMPHDELSFAGLCGILEQYRELLESWRRRAGRPVYGQITVTGGEPFSRRDFVELIERFATHRSEFRFAILTNGTLIDADMAARLRELRPTFVQVSIDGTGPTHDAIRGKGTFEKAVNGIRHLVAAGICTLISFTAHRGNFREFGDVARLGQSLRVSRVWADRLIPTGAGGDLELMTAAETREFMVIMARARQTARRRWFNRTEISMNRALQFLTGGDRPYRCSAGDTLLTLQPNGDLYPCRRMPIRVGNVTQRPLAELYADNTLLRALRGDVVSEGCQGCLYRRTCGGGLRCLSYAVHGDPFRADPQCWHADSASAGGPALLDVARPR